MTASQEYLRIILDSIHDGVFIAQDEHLAFCNGRLARILGTTVGDLVGSNFAEIVTQEDLPLFAERFRNRIVGEDPPGVYEVHFRHRETGDSVPLMLHATLIDYDGRAGVLGTVADLSDRQRYEETLRRAQKMEAIGELAGGVAHDFSNILGIILGNLELLRKRESDDERSRKQIESALKAVRRGTDLTRRLLGFSHQEATTRQRTDLVEFVGDLRELIAKSVTPRITVEIDVDRGVWPVEVDPGDLGDALINLAVNARDAMPTGGRLVVEASNRTLDENYIRLNPDAMTGDHVLISVSDTGTGMPRDVAQRIFEPFFTTKSKGKGTGLGLAMVYGCIKRCGGHVRVYSEVGHGTSFNIYIPRAAPENEAEVGGKVDQGKTRGGSETVLIVDDEEMLREIAVEYLESLGYLALAAEDGPSALGIIEKRDDIDLLFADVVMPGDLDGYNLARQALRRRPDLRVLFTSGFTKGRVRSTSRGDRLTNAWLHKPYTEQELATAVRDALDGPPPALDG